MVIFTLKICLINFYIYIVKGEKVSASGRVREVCDVTRSDESYFSEAAACGFFWNPLSHFSLRPVLSWSVKGGLVRVGDRVREFRHVLLSLPTEKFRLPPTQSALRR